MIPSIGELTTWLTFLRAGEWEAESMKEVERKPQPHCNLISEVTFYHCGRVLFVRTESLGLVFIQGEGITLGHENQEVGIDQNQCWARYLAEPWEASRRPLSGNIERETVRERKVHFRCEGGKGTRTPPGLFPLPILHLRTKVYAFSSLWKTVQP